MPNQKPPLYNQLLGKLQTEGGYNLQRAQDLLERIEEECVYVLGPVQDNRDVLLLTGVVVCAHCQNPTHVRLATPKYIRRAAKRRRYFLRMITAVLPDPFNDDRGNLVQEPDQFFNIQGSLFSFVAWVHDLPGRRRRIDLMFDTCVGFPDRFHSWEANAGLNEATLKLKAARILRLNGCSQAEIDPYLSQVPQGYLRMMVGRPLETVATVIRKNMPLVTALAVPGAELHGTPKSDYQKGLARVYRALNSEFPNVPHEMQDAVSAACATAFEELQERGEGYYYEGDFFNYLKGIATANLRRTLREQASQKPIKPGTEPTPKRKGASNQNIPEDWFHLCRLFFRPHGSSLISPRGLADAVWHHTRDESDKLDKELAEQLGVPAATVATTRRRLRKYIQAVHHVCNADPARYTPGDADKAMFRKLFGQPDTEDGTLKQTLRHVAAYARIGRDDQDFRLLIWVKKFLEDRAEKRRAGNSRTGDDSHEDVLFWRQKRHHLGSGDMRLGRLDRIETWLGNEDHRSRLTELTNNPVADTPMFFTGSVWYMVVALEAPISEILEVLCPQDTELSGVKQIAIRLGGH